MHDESTILDPALERFVRRETDPPYCIVWIGAKRSGGYGTFRGKAAHRVSYERAYGAVPLGLHVLHRCDNRACVRPEHLWAGTHLDNMRDKMSKGRAGRPDWSRRKAKADTAWSSRLWTKRRGSIRHDPVAAALMRWPDEVDVEGSSP